MNEKPAESPPIGPTDFIYVICQNGAEAATKLEILSAHQNLKLAFSRPGFITFKVDAEDQLPLRFSLRSTLARAYGWSIGKAQNEQAQELVQKIVDEPVLQAASHLHIWQRDSVMPGKNGFEPGISPLAQAMGELFKESDLFGKNEIPVNQAAKPDELVFDIVMVEPNEWWFGFHFANTIAGRWPGGVPFVDTQIETCSRAYYKVKEALLWSGIKIQPGDRCAEIGSSPGGACQYLLESGATVIGIDPAEMEPMVLEHENFTHIRRRGHEVKKRDFRNVRWLFADLNVDPEFTLTMVEEICSHDLVDFRGIVLTLKLTDWNKITEVPKLIKRVKAMGFQVAKSRQLAFNRKEFCLVGVKDKFLLRLGKKSAGKTTANGG